MDDRDFMSVALRHARLGAGRVNPNPMVGTVIVRDGEIIATGHHDHFGGWHAERAALEAAKQAGVDVRGATIYVTLEPCCHTGKQPPCSKALIDAGLARVVIGSPDPNPLVADRTIIGESIAVNGVCLTVTAVHGTAFTADVMHETLRRTGSCGSSPRRGRSPSRASA